MGEKRKYADGHEAPIAAFQLIRRLIGRKRMGILIAYPIAGNISEQLRARKESKDCE